MRELMLEALVAHAKGHIQKHFTNVEIYLNNPAGIGEHSDIIETIEHELEQMSKYNEQLQILEEYFM